jgi:hypothetical protein
MNRFPLGDQSKPIHPIKAPIPKVVNSIPAATTKKRAEVATLVNSV